MPLPIASAAVAEAHRRGKLVFAHPSNVVGLEVALAARVDVLAHAIEGTSGLTADHLRRMKAQNVSLVPTLKLFGGRTKAGEKLSTDA
jgi:imidazolonepropionase-like amidohydrolase